MKQSVRDNSLSAIDLQFEKHHKVHVTGHDLSNLFDVDGNEIDEEMVMNIPPPPQYSRAISTDYYRR